MRWMRRALVVIACAVSLALPGQAFALVLAPPGHAGANQYFETIPTSAGNAAPPGSVRGSGSGTATNQALSGLGQGSGTDAKLARLGKDGQAAAALAASTAPSAVSGATGAKGKSLTATASAPSGSVVSGLSHALTGAGSGGLGLLLPMLLATGLIAAVGIAVARLRGRANPPQPGV
jgi:hypothetical protein